MPSAWHAVPADINMARMNQSKKRLKHACILADHSRSWKRLPDGNEYKGQHVADYQSTLSIARNIHLNCGCKRRIKLKLTLVHKEETSLQANLTIPICILETESPL
jgi:hypothetical protein